MKYHIKHLKVHYNKLYYQKAVPVKLQAAVGKKTVKQLLELKNGSSAAAVAAEIAKVDELYVAWFKTLQDDNQFKLNEIEKLKAAKAFLQQNGMREGSLAPLERGTDYQKDQYDRYINAKAAIFDSGYLSYKLKNQMQFTLQEEIEDIAWTLATKPQELLLPYTFKDAWDWYAKIKNIDARSAEGKKKASPWNRFISVVGNQEFTKDDIYEAQRQYASHVIVGNGRKPKTAERELATVVAAFRSFETEHKLHGTVIKYVIQQEAEQEDRTPISDQDLLTLWEVITTDTTIRPYVRLTLMLMCQTSMIASEIYRLKVADLILPSHPEYKGVSWVRVKKGKTKDRVRPVPLVAGIDLIQELVKEVAEDGKVLGAGTETTSVWLNILINRAIKNINPELTGYSTRHGWLHRSFIAETSADFQDRVGGWTGGNKSAKNSYAKMADTSIERLKLYERAQIKVNRLLRSKEDGSVVAFKRR